MPPPVFFPLAAHLLCCHPSTPYHISSHRELMYLGTTSPKYVRSKPLLTWCTYLLLSASPEICRCISISATTPPKCHRLTPHTFFFVRGNARAYWQGMNGKSEGGVSCVSDKIVVSLIATQRRPALPQKAASARPRLGLTCIVGIYEIY